MRADLMDYHYKDPLAEKQRMYKNRFRIKTMCPDCGSVRYYGWLEFIVQIMALLFLVFLAVTGGLFIYDQYQNDGAIVGFYINDKSLDTKMQQMFDMSRNYAGSDNFGLLWQYTYKIIYSDTIAREQLTNRTYELSEIETIRALHHAINTETIYVNDTTGMDILMSPLITISRGGDCEDRAVLFLTMAQIAGLECYPALTPNHAIAYCLYGDLHERIVFVDVGVRELGLDIDMIQGDISLFKAKT
jgi:hypothetical protein